MNRQENSVTAWQQRCELEAQRLGQPPKLGRVCFWALILDGVQDWPQPQFERWARQATRVYGGAALATYDHLMRIFTENREAYSEVVLRVHMSTPGMVVYQFMEE